MTCKNCDPALHCSGRVIQADSTLGYCAICRDPITYSRPKITNTWDTYFHSICTAVASKSPCLSRKIGAILVKDHSIVSTGFNGPSRGIPHCGHERLLKDDLLAKAIPLGILPARLNSECPRRILGIPSGEGMQWCPAQHSEENAISNAARLGVSTIGTTLYMNCVIPCQKCYGTLINAGITEIVVDSVKVYDSHTQYLIDNSIINIRSFEL